jgi:restriction endonuclease S subunit
MSFQISPELDANKVFLVRSSELEGRLDPNFYRPLASVSKNMPLYSIRSISNLLLHPPEYKRIYVQSGMQLIRSQNVRPEGIDLTNSPVYLDNSLLSKKDIIPQIGDVLVVRSGVNSGDTATVTEEMQNSIIGADTILIRLKKIVNPKFIQTFFSLPIGKEIMGRHLTGATNKHISPFNLGKIKIPVPPLAIQSAIVAKMDAAYASKRAKEAEAQRLLDSIDDYLLRELGIELPEQEENTVQSRIFTRRFSEISGGRLDPNTYKKERVEVIKRIRKGRYASKPVYLILEHKNNRTSQIDEKTLYIGLENIKSNTGEWVASDVKESVSSAAVFSKNDILFPKLRPYLNKVYFAEMNGICSTEFHVFRAYHDDNQYISTFLRSKAVVCQTKCLMSGNTLPRLQFEDIQKLLIPLPPLEKQTEIADHIAQIRRRAKQLQQEAVEGLEQAKLEVEALLLGDAQK